MSLNRERSFFADHFMTALWAKGAYVPPALTADITLAINTPSVVILDAQTTAGRKVIMPAPTDIEGKIWFIRNIAAATGTLAVRNSADSSTLVTVGVQSGAIGGYFGGTWRSLVNGAVA